MSTLRPHRSRHGFTLIEVVITLSIFVLLAAAVFGIFSATLESASGLQDNQNDEDLVESLNAFLKKSLLDLPADGKMISYHRDGAPSQVSGLIWGAAANLQALDMMRQADGFYSLRLATYSRPSDLPVDPFADFQQQVLSEDSSLAWRVLVRGVRTADWRFRSFPVPQWAQQVSGRPTLAEFTVQLATSGTAVTTDVWLPPLQSPNLPTSSVASNNGNGP